MPGHPSVDIIIAAYNAEGFIAETLDSLAAQTLRPSRIIVTDDGSTDATAKIVDQWATGQTIPVQLIRQVNCGAPSARNAAIRQSTADLVMMIDADDISLPDTLASLASAFDQIEGLALCFGDTSLFNSSGIIERSFLHKKGIEREPFKTDITGARILINPAFTSLVSGNYIPVCTAMFPRHLGLRIGLFDTSLRCSEDLDFFMRLSRTGAVAYYPRTLAMVRRHANNLTNSKNAMVLDGYRVRVLSKMLRLTEALRLTDSEIAAAKRARALAASDLLYNASVAGWRIYLRQTQALLRQGVVRPAINWKHLARGMVPAKGIMHTIRWFGRRSLGSGSERSVS